MLHAARKDLRPDRSAGTTAAAERPDLPEIRMQHPVGNAADGQGKAVPSATPPARARIEAMTLCTVQECAPDGWDEFVARFPSSGPFHTRAWCESFRNADRTPIYLRLLSRGTPVGGAAGILYSPAPAFLRGLDRRAFFFSGPALAAMDGASIRACIGDLRRHAEDRGVTSLINLGRDYPYAYDWGGSRAHVHVTHEYLVELRGPWQDVKARMRRSIPEQERKAERAGLTFHVHRDASMLSPLMELLESTRLRRLRKSGIHFSPYYLPHLGDSNLRSLAASDIARFFVARRGDAPLCVLLVLAFRKRAYALWIGCADEGYRLRAPAFVWYNAMRALAAEGTESLNLAGAGPSVAFAKTSLGAERRECTGSVSPYLQGPVRNLLFQTLRRIYDPRAGSAIPASARLGGV